MLNSPTTNTLDGPLAALRESEIRLMGEIAATLADGGDAALEDRKRIQDVAQDLREAFFLVVVIGEFNAGKSTFINALLGDELLPTGITPTTEAIELIRYSDTPIRKPETKNNLREWGHPNTGAPGVAIVDTPGTGSVFEKHSQTAQAFLHRSDLVIFIISAKRAFAQTEKLYLEMAKNYGKKIIMVINQMDLLNPGEREQVKRFVETQIHEMLDIQPLIFTVSSKEALMGQRENPGAGGIDAVRAHLRGVFADIPPAKQKLLTQLESAERIVQKHFDEAKLKADLVSADTAKAKEIQQELQQQAGGLSAQLRTARQEIDQIFNGIRQRGLTFIDDQLSLRRIGRSLNHDALQKQFQEQVIGRAVRDVNEATTAYVNAVIDHSRAYWRSVIERLNQLREIIQQEMGGLDAGVYAEQRESLEEAIRIAESELRSYSTGQVLGQLETTFNANLGGLLISSVATIGGLIAAVLAVATPGAIIGSAFPLVPIAFFIGAPVAAIGSVFAVRYLRRISNDAKRDFNERIDQLTKTYNEALDVLISKERSRLSQYGSQILTPIFSRLEVLAKRYGEQQAKFREHLEQIGKLRTGIQESR